MLDYSMLPRALADIGLESWRNVVEPLIRERFSSSHHGDFDRWREIVGQLPSPDSKTSRELLLQLAPWRKGPFRLGDIEIDAEWRSNLKWDRLKDAIKPLDGRRVLDVGCGNGYYALRMKEAGAGTVIGIEPMVLYVMQFLAVQRFLDTTDVFVLPLRLEELPDESRVFDTCFSMGVLYHQEFSLPHLAALKNALRPGGELVLETLYLRGDVPWAVRPDKRYTRMRNVGELPTIPKLTDWLRIVGYEDIRIVDESVTTPEEQRSTEWMPFESLAEALDPDDSTKTVEGLPAPRRVIAVANTP